MKCVQLIESVTIKYFTNLLLFSCTLVLIFIRNEKFKFYFSFYLISSFFLRDFHLKLVFSDLN